MTDRTNHGRVGAWCFTGRFILRRPDDNPRSLAPGIVKRVLRWRYPEGSL